MQGGKQKGQKVAKSGKKALFCRFLPSLRPQEIDLMKRRSYVLN
jgi:hypothetical protein